MADKNTHGTTCRGSLAFHNLLIPLCQAHLAQTHSLLRLSLFFSVFLPSVPSYAHSLSASLVPLISFSLSLLASGRSVIRSWFPVQPHTCAWLKLCFGTCWPPHLTDSSGALPVCIGSLHMSIIWANQYAYTWVSTSVAVYRYVSAMNLSLSFWKNTKKCSGSSTAKGLLTTPPFYWPFSWLKSFSPSVTWTAAIQRDNAGVSRAAQAAKTGRGGFECGLFVCCWHLNQLDLPWQITR